MLSKCAVVTVLAAASLLLSTQGLTIVSRPHIKNPTAASQYQRSVSSLLSLIGLGEYYVSLAGSGIRRTRRRRGGQVASLADGAIASGDVLLDVDGNDSASTASFEEVMDRIAAVESPFMALKFSDGLGRMDMPKNVPSQRIGQFLKVEVVIGGAVRDDGRCLVRFFAIFSNDGGASTYSCNVLMCWRRGSGKERTITYKLLPYRVRRMKAWDKTWT